MPFFSSKFSPKKTPLRRNQLNGNNKESLDELVSETGVIKLNLHEQKLTFENGHWFAENGKNSSLHKSNVKLKQQIQALQEENNMLKLKNEILLNMLTETTAEHQTQEKELNRLRQKQKNSSK